MISDPTRDEEIINRERNDEKEIIFMITRVYVILFVGIKAREEKRVKEIHLSST
jgi:hypothetical protein